MAGSVSRYHSHLYLLGESTEAATALQTELADVLGDRVPTVADLPRLRYTEAVVFEALRLYSPAYVLSREAIKPTIVGGRALPKSGIAFIRVWATHRRAHLFEAPSMFRPERWLDGLARRLPRGAYLPFADGPRKCIGASHCDAGNGSRPCHDRPALLSQTYRRPGDPAPGCRHPEAGGADQAGGSSASLAHGGRRGLSRGL